MLRDGEQDGLMVHRGVDGGQLVHAGREAHRDVRGENAVHRSAVQALEERKEIEIVRRRLRERRELLHDDVGVAPDDTLRVQLLGRRIVVLLRVDKVAGLEVPDGHRDCEGRIGPERAKVGRECEFARGHEVSRDDFAHDGRVAGSRSDLSAVGDRLAGAKVDKVVTGSEGGDLARRRVRLSVVEETGNDLSDIECWISMTLATRRWNKRSNDVLSEV